MYAKNKIFLKLCPKIISCYVFYYDDLHLQYADMEGEKMKRRTKLLLCSLTAAAGLLAAVPVTASAAEFTEKPKASSWYKDKDGQIFYYDDKTKAVTGEKTIGGEQ